MAQFSQVCHLKNYAPRSGTTERRFRPPDLPLRIEDTAGFWIYVPHDGRRASMRGLALARSVWARSDIVPAEYGQQRIREGLRITPSPRLTVMAQSAEGRILWRTAPPTPV